MIGKNQAALAGYKMGRAFVEAERRAAAELARLKREAAAANETRRGSAADLPSTGEETFDQSDPVCEAGE